MNRFDLNRTRPVGKARVAFNEAKRVLDAGMFCDDCKAIHADRKAVAFITVEAPVGSDVDFFVSFLCSFHADIFLMKQENTGVFLNGKKIMN